MTDDEITRSANDIFSRVEATNKAATELQRMIRGEIIQRLRVADDRTVVAFMRLADRQEGGTEALRFAVEEAAGRFVSIVNRQIVEEKKQAELARK